MGKCPQCNRPWDIEETPVCEGCGLNWEDVMAASDHYVRLMAEPTAAPSPIKWIPTTEERYDEMMGVLPPAAYAPGFCGFSAFLVGEPMSTRNGAFTFSAFKFEDGIYYESDEAVTFREFKAEMKKAEYCYAG